MTIEITLMPEFASNFGSMLVVGAAVILGGVALYGIFDKRRGEVKKEENAVEDRLISLMKQEREELNKRLDEQDQVITELETKVDKMTHENELLIKVLQGKDEASKQYQKDAYVAMGKLDILLDLAKVNNDNITKLISIIDRRFDQPKN